MGRKAFPEGLHSWLIDCCRISPGVVLRQCSALSKRARDLLYRDEGRKLLNHQPSLTGTSLNHILVSRIKFDSLSLILSLSTLPAPRKRPGYSLQRVCDCVQGCGPFTIVIDASTGHSFDHRNFSLLQTVHSNTIDSDSPCTRGCNVIEKPMETKLEFSLNILAFDRLQYNRK